MLLQRIGVVLVDSLVLFFFFFVYKYFKYNISSSVYMNDPKKLFRIRVQRTSYIYLILHLDAEAGIESAELNLGDLIGGVEDAGPRLV